MASERIVATSPLPDWCANLIAPRTLDIASSTSPYNVLALLDTRTVGLIARSSTPVTAEMMDAAPSLKAIGRTGVGYDSIDVQAATRRDIPVLYAPHALTRPTAEHTLALILAAAKDLPGWHRAVVNGRWEERNSRRNLDLQGAVVGIVGFGRIGRMVRRMLRPFQVEVLVCDPAVEQALAERENVRLMTLEPLLRESRIVSLHLPLTAESRGLIDRTTIEWFRPGAILVNAARGALIESHQLLLEALERGLLARVALDTPCDEPPHPEDALMRHPDLIVSPHVASRTPGAQETILRTLFADLAAVLNGDRPELENVVNPEVFGSGQSGLATGREAADPAQELS